MTVPISIRCPMAPDYKGWQSLWRKYCIFHHVEIPDSVTETVWRRICEPHGLTRALLATTGDSEIVGFVNYVVHPYTWSDKPLCFLIDLYVETQWRQNRIANTLIAALVSRGKSEGWLRIYWNTDKTNEPARSWYEKIARRSPYLTYVLDLDVSGRSCGL